MYPLFFKEYEPYAGAVEEITVQGPDGPSIIKVDLESITAEELPTQIKLYDEIEVMSENGESMKLGTGYIATLLSYHKGIIEVADVSKEFKGEVSYDRTNFTAQIATVRLYEKLGIPMPQSEESKEPENNKKQGKPAQNKPKKKPKNKPKKKEAELIANEVAEVQTESPEPETVVEVEVEVEVEEVVPEVSTTLDESGIINAMKESLNSNPLAEFTADGVKKWESGEDETVDGIDYQVGLATYLKDTILGDQPAQAKALIRNGEVSKWVFANTGAEIE